MTLRHLIGKTPELLPLPGDNRRWGLGYADLGWRRRDGLVIIEVRLAQNNEARRHGVAQILVYGASLRHSPRTARRPLR